MTATEPIPGRGVYTRYVGDGFTLEYRRTSRGGEYLAAEHRTTVTTPDGQTRQGSWVPAGIYGWDAEYHQHLCRHPGGAAVVAALEAEQRYADLCHAVGFVEGAPAFMVADELADRGLYAEAAWCREYATEATWTW